MILIPLQPLHPTNIIIVPADSQSAGTVRHSSNPLNENEGGKRVLSVSTFCPTLVNYSGKIYASFLDALA